MVDTPSTKPRLDKLGVKPGARVALLGIADTTFAPELKKRTSDISTQPKKDSDLIFLAAASKRS
jgi:hypothetical protein